MELSDIKETVLLCEYNLLLLLDLDLKNCYK